MKRITWIFTIAATAALAGCAVYPDGTPAYGGGYAPGYDPGYGYDYGAAPVPQSNVYLGFGGYSGPSYDDHDHGYGRGYGRGYDRGYNHDRPPPPPQQQGHGGGPGPQAGNGWRGGGTPGAGVGRPPPHEGGGQGSRGDRDSGRQSAQDYNNGGGSRH
jgi:hypothetical protein